jgi:hypothetical protein
VIGAEEVWDFADAVGVGTPVRKLGTTTISMAGPGRLPSVETSIVVSDAVLRTVLKLITSSLATDDTINEDAGIIWKT